MLLSDPDGDPDPEPSMGPHPSPVPHRFEADAAPDRAPALPILPTPQPAHAPDGLEIRHIGTGEALYATRAFAAGEPIFTFDHISWRPRRDRYTVQTPDGQHLYDPILARVAHACDPNGRPSFRLMALVARRDIAPGALISFDYLTTEAEIADPFDCRCGAPACRRRIDTAMAQAVAAALAAEPHPTPTCAGERT
ncbi:hypothetical protein ACO2Q3_14380 [Caulobacter sp. KR2-114]|uniref:hypothetical protein n=1 Tax=Caulobacter sp. KR2-114 TaxID=3400912 RepID=UPI003BFD3C96